MDFMRLEHYLRGPPSGDLVKGLAEIRLAVLRHGIPSNNDGIVTLCSLPTLNQNTNKFSSLISASTSG